MASARLGLVGRDAMFYSERMVKQRGHSCIEQVEWSHVQEYWSKEGTICQSRVGFDEWLASKSYWLLEN